MAKKKKPAAKPKSAKPPKAKKFLTDTSAGTAEASVRNFFAFGGFADFGFAAGFFFFAIARYRPEVVLEWWRAERVQPAPLHGFGPSFDVRGQHLLRPGQEVDDFVGAFPRGEIPICLPAAVQNGVPESPQDFASIPLAGR